MNFKDLWKSKQYWLKGGIILVCAYIIISLILLPFNTTCDGAVMFCPPLAIIPTILGGLLWIPLTGLIDMIVGYGSIDNISPIIEIVILILFSIISYFIIGALIGWIISWIYEK